MAPLFLEVLPCWNKQQGITTIQSCFEVDFSFRMKKILRLAQEPLNIPSHVARLAQW
jgi:hypothetical protein